MDSLISLVLTMMLIVWSIFQPALYMNAQLVEEDVSVVVYETQKDAAVQGHYTQDMYNQIINELGTVYKFDTTKVTIQGTESLTTRGNPITIKVSIPRPPTDVFNMLSSNTGTYTYTKTILSEYTP